MLGRRYFLNGRRSKNLTAYIEASPRMAPQDHTAHHDGWRRYFFPASFAAA
jgi:hypothetical protein